MDLRSGCPFWVLQAGEQAAWPDLDADARAEVLVVGGGITGALTAWRLAAAGIDTMVLDRREIALGSTAASTALLQYELDTPLRELRRLRGSPLADRAYLRCVSAFDELDVLLDALGEPAGFARRQSLYLASSSDEVAELRREGAARAEIGIAVEYLDRGELRRHFGIDRPGALLSAVGGEVDAYRLTLRLTEAAVALGARVRTGPDAEVTRLEPGATVKAHTAGGHAIRARRVVLATGYEFAPCLPPGDVELRSTYVVATPPLAAIEPWPGRAIIWETARPYLYLRTIADGRIIVGGADEPFSGPAERDALIESKTQQLLELAGDLFPALELTADCAWAGAFAETPDGLPYIGPIPGMPGVYGSLAFGGNGITFGIIAAEMLLALCRDGIHRDTELYAFDR